MLSVGNLAERIERLRPEDRLELLLIVGRLLASAEQRAVNEILDESSVVGGHSTDQEGETSSISRSRG